MDKVGNRLTNTKSDTKTTYGYDAIYRLLTAQPNRRDQAETYSYDPVGNRLTGPERTTSYTYGSGNELLKRELIGFILDNNGNLIAKGEHIRAHDHKGNHWGHHRNHDRHGNGNEHHGKGWIYTYDFENRLIKAEKKQGHDVATVTYKYDPLGRRIEKRVREGEHCRDEDEVIHSYVYDGQSIILEYETTGEGRHKKTETTKYVHGPNIDEPLAMTRDNEVYYYHADGLGSIVALTDKRQKTVESYEYDSFGNLKQDDKKMMQPFTYTGREWDKETGTYHYRKRTYDPMDGRFIQKDPIGFKGGINLYNYTDSNPVNRTDPTGEAWNGNVVPGTYRQDYVCTVPAAFNFLNDNKCTQQCCKEHDDCYAKNGCNASSWIVNGITTIPLGACQMCNVKAVACILSNLSNDKCDDCKK